MNKKDQAQRAQTLLNLHHAADVLLLPNVWNPIGARILEKKGYPAVATASAAVAEMLGYQDGEQLRIDTLLDVLGRVAHAVDVPVSADIESGYARTPSEFKNVIQHVLEAGIVGINLEDSDALTGKRRTATEHSEFVAVAREAAGRMGVHLVINARPDSFFWFNSAQEALEDAVGRAEAYIAAGADCVYPIGASSAETIKQLCQRIAAPINILGSSTAPSLADLQEIGINRVSLGPFVFRSVLKKFADIADELLETGSYGAFARNALSGGEVNAFLRDSAE